MADRSSYGARVQFLGAQRIEIGNEVVTPEAERLFAMIVRLSVPLGRITSRQTMMDTLWPGSDDANARHNLRQTVYKAREIGLVVESGEDGLRLDPRHWSCDWDDPEGDVGGEWLADYEPAFSEDLAAWVTSQRIGVHALIRPRIMRALQRARSAGDLLRADRYAAQLLQIDELNEEATLTRAELLAMQGAKVDALRLLDAYLNEIGRLGAGKDAALPAHLLRRRIAEKLPVVSYQNGVKHHGPLVGRERELKRLVAGLFDARAGRGGAILLHGPEGSGKSRLLHEVKKSAMLQGMRVIEMSVESIPSPMPFQTLRRLVERLLELPGALGVSPEALGRMREWLRRGDSDSYHCPAFEIEDLFASVSEETPCSIQLEHSERIDAESLAQIDRLYARAQRRHHAFLMTSSTPTMPVNSPIDIQWIERLALRPMNTADLQSLLAAYAAEEQPRATQDQISFASLFAEGVPMYGIEMLGLILDSGSPDKIPWRVKVAVDRASRELTELQLRLLLLCVSLGASARQSVLADALNAAASEFADALDGLETRGYVNCIEGVLFASNLLSTPAQKRLRAGVVRMDALSAARALTSDSVSAYACDDVFARIRLLIHAMDERTAYRVLDENAGSLVRKETAGQLVFQLSRLEEIATTKPLRALLGSIIDQIRIGSESRRRPQLASRDYLQASSLPNISEGAVEAEHSYVSHAFLAKARTAARNPRTGAARRLSEATTALIAAANLGEREAMENAFEAVNAVRYSPDVNRFDLHRAELIYFASFGDRTKALACAKRVAEESRTVSDVHLACKGFRNAAEAMALFGEIGDAQSMIHEARALAVELQYPAQIASADVRLADLAIEVMDTEGARTYLASAEQIIFEYRLTMRVLLADVNFHSCWEALMREDLQKAAKAAKAVVRLLRDQKLGVSLSALLGVQLATHRGRVTKETHSAFERLKASIGSTPYNANEQRSLAALLLFARNTGELSEVSEFVGAQVLRLEAAGRTVWPYLLTSLSQR